MQVLDLTRFTDVLESICIPSGMHLGGRRQDYFRDEFKNGYPKSLMDQGGYRKFSLSSNLW
jgi:hypothetical protein